MHAGKIVWREAEVNSCFFLSLRGQHQPEALGWLSLTRQKVPEGVLLGDFHSASRPLVCGVPQDSTDISMDTIDMKLLREDVQRFRV